MKLVLFVGIIAVTLAIGESFQCYNCTNCGDPFNKDTGKTITCRGDPICVKSVTEFGNNDKVVKRSCAEFFYLRGASRVNETIPKLVTIHPCDKELCNGAPSIQSVSLIISILTISTIKLIQ